jgi:dienelactone hydrolase
VSVAWLHFTKAAHAKASMAVAQCMPPSMLRFMQVCTLALTIMFTVTVPHSWAAQRADPVAEVVSITVTVSVTAKTTSTAATATHSNSINARAVTQGKASRGPSSSPSTTTLGNPPAYTPGSTLGTTPGTTLPMVTQVFKPAGRGPFKILLYAHGRPGYASERAQFKEPLFTRHVQYWQAKGYAVVAPIRPGYGTPPSGTGGADQESSGVGYNEAGQCIRQPRPEQLANNAAAAQRAALDWVRQQPWARKDHIVLEGRSGGGLATVALCAATVNDANYTNITANAPNAKLPVKPPARLSNKSPSNSLGIVGCINFSGGVGGDPVHAPGQVCAPEKTAALMARYGATTTAPSIWLYAANDLYWGAAAPVQWQAAFNQTAQTAGHAPLTFIQTPPIGSDGHSLQRAGTAHWQPALDAWLKKNKL